MEQLAKHLGHDAKTHKEFYRLSDSTVQLSKACVASCYHFMLIRYAYCEGFFVYK